MIYIVSSFLYNSPLNYFLTLKVMPFFAQCQHIVIAAMPRNEFPSNSSSIPIPILWPGPPVWSLFWSGFCIVAASDYHSMCRQRRSIISISQ